jgi:hypothetical protein
MLVQTRATAVNADRTHRAYRTSTRSPGHPLASGSSSRVRLAAPESDSLATRRGGLRQQSQSRQIRRNAPLSQEPTDGSGTIGVGAMSLGCTGVLADASATICLVVASVSTRLIASSNIERSWSKSFLLNGRSPSWYDCTARARL